MVECSVQARCREMSADAHAATPTSLCSRTLALGAQTGASLQRHSRRVCVARSRRLGRPGPTGGSPPSRRLALRRRRAAPRSRRIGTKRRAAPRCVAQAIANASSCIVGRLGDPVTRARKGRPDAKANAGGAYRTNRRLGTRCVRTIMVAREARAQADFPAPRFGRMKSLRGKYEYL